MNVNSHTESIRQATLEDLPALVDLLGILFTQEEDFHPDAVKQERALRMILESPQVGTVFVACQTEKVVGMVCMLWTISTAEGGKACWMEDVVVHPDHRGGGLGTRLVEEAIRQAQEMACLRIAVLTDQGNHGARKLYERLGFEMSSMVCLKKKIGPKSLNEEV